MPDRKESKTTSIKDLMAGRKVKPKGKIRARQLAIAIAMKKAGG
jgi:hypothetical protein